MKKGNAPTTDRHLRQRRLEEPDEENTTSQTERARKDALQPTRCSSSDSFQAFCRNTVFARCKWLGRRIQTARRRNRPRYGIPRTAKAMRKTSYFTICTANKEPRNASEYTLRRSCDYASERSAAKSEVTRAGDRRAPQGA